MQVNSNNKLCVIVPTEEEANNIATDLIKSDMTDTVEIIPIIRHKARYLSGDRSEEITRGFKVIVNCKDVRNLQTQGIMNYQKIVYEKYGHKDYYTE